MSLILVWCARIPILRVARIAGQFAKPRTSNFEKLPDGRQVHSFKGDNVNGFDSSDRTPDPNRLILAYFHSSATLNYIRYDFRRSGGFTLSERVEPEQCT